MRPTTTTAARDRLARRRALLGIGALAVGAGLWIAGAMAVPGLRDAHPVAATLLSGFYSPVCHQETGRCLNWAGGAMAVCARCFGLYVGGLLGLLAAARRCWRGRPMPSPRWFWIAIVPTAIDALLPWVGLPQLARLPRAALAVTAGAAAGLFLGYAVLDLMSSVRVNRRDETLLVPALPTSEDCNDPA